MANTVLIVEDNASYRKVLGDSLRREGYRVLEAGDGRQALDILQTETVSLLLTDVYMPGMDGIELIEQARSLNPALPTIVMTGHGTNETIIEALKHHACDFLAKPIKIDDLQRAVRTALKHIGTCEIEVISATPQWIEIRVPCDLGAVEPIQNFITGLECTLPEETRDSISSAFHEMLTNAIEHGGKGDPSKKVDIKWIRLKRAVLYSIKDPGDGFNLQLIRHSAVTNPEEDPYRHLAVREEQGLRPGGFGIMLASKAIDELIYNEKHNELVFVKYLDPDPNT